MKVLSLYYVPPILFSETSGHVQKAHILLSMGYYHCFNCVIFQDRHHRHILIYRHFTLQPLSTMSTISKKYKIINITNYKIYNMVQSHNMDPIAANFTEILFTKAKRLLPYEAFIMISFQIQYTVSITIRFPY